MNILVTGVWRGFNPDIEKKLNMMGHKVKFLQWEKDQLPCEPQWVEGMVCSYPFENRDIRDFTRLRYIQLSSSGMDKFTDREWEFIKGNRILIHNAIGIYSIPMAEYALGMVLNIYRGIGIYGENQKYGDWVKVRNLRELYRSRVCIIGCGSVGSECAKRFKAMGCHVTGINRTVYDVYDGFDEMHGMEKLDKAIDDSDIIIICVPLNDDTRYLFNRDRLGRIKEGQIVINMSRGAVLETEGLRDAKGIYVLDVFEEEPLPKESFLWNRDNVYLSPHNSWVGDGNDDRLTKLILKNLEEFE